jgi:hypothetical protein
MSSNPVNNTPDRSLLQEIADLKKKLEDLRTNQLAVIVIPVVSSDPSTPTNGQIWYNSTSNTFKCRQGGVTKTFTTT